MFRVSFPVYHPSCTTEYLTKLVSLNLYSKVPNKRSATFVYFRSFLRGLRSHLKGIRLSILTKCFSHKSHFRKVGTKTPYIIKSFFSWMGYSYLRGAPIVSAKFSKGYVNLGKGATLIRNSTG